MQELVEARIALLAVQEVRELLATQQKLALATTRATPHAISHIMFLGGDYI